MNKELLQKIFTKTDGNCHICHKKLSFKNYAKNGAAGAWEVEHSKPKAKGGTNNINNLFPAHIKCNRKKGILNSKTVRAHHGISRAPYSKLKKDKIKSDNTAGGAIIGGGIGLVIGGPIGGIVGSFIGGIIGNDNSPKK